MRNYPPVSRGTEYGLYFPGLTLVDAVESHVFISVYISIRLDKYLHRSKIECICSNFYRSMAKFASGLDPSNGRLPPHCIPG
jgi:hypothetical protein